MDRSSGSAGPRHAVHPAVDRVLVPVAGLLLSVVGLVLLIACANLASFLLAGDTTLVVSRAFPGRPVAGVLAANDPGPDFG